MRNILSQPVFKRFEGNAFGQKVTKTVMAMGLPGSSPLIGRPVTWLAGKIGGKVLGTLGRSKHVNDWSRIASRKLMGVGQGQTGGQPEGTPGEQGGQPEEQQGNPQQEDMFGSFMDFVFLDRKS